jgi:two-component system cell cycle sensor histidine kinase/response regulator CckA
MLTADQPGHSPHRSTGAEALGHRSGAIAHDFNHLLMVIASGCERLRASGDLPAHHLAEVEQIAVATEYAASLAAEVLTADRPAMPPPAPLDLGAAVLRLRGVLQRTLGDQVTLSVRVAPQPTPAHLNQGDIAQILVNLAVNARDAMPQGGAFSLVTSIMTVDAATAARRQIEPGTYVALEVSDTGTGMAPDVQARAFERFFTTKAAGQGTGQGLSTVLWAVRRRGGSIDVLSEPGNGTHFLILLPLADARAMGSGPTADPATRRGRGERVLVVENDAFVRDCIVFLLGTMGYDAKDAPSAHEALRMARELPSPFDLLITDLDMPDLDGRALAAQFAALSARTRVLFISGDAQGLAASGERTGAGQPVATLQKPFTSHALRQQVQAILDAQGAGDS